MEAPESHVCTPDAPLTGTSPSAAERIAALTFHAKGVSQADIARKLDRDPKTIARIIAQDSPQAVQQALASYSADWVDLWHTAAVNGARKGRHEPARDALIASKLVEPLAASASGSGITLMIGISLPGLSSPSSLPGLPVLEVEATPTPEPCGSSDTGETLQKP